MNSLVSLLIVLAAIALVATTGIVLWLFTRNQRKNFRGSLKLELRNDGNVPGRYELKAEDPTGALRFQWLLQGAALGAKQAPQITSAPQLPPPQQTSAPKPASSGGGLAQGVGVLKGASGVISEVLINVGYMLPRSMGLPLINLGSQLRSGQYSAERAANLPNQVARMNPLAPKNQVYASGSNQPAWTRTTPQPATANTVTMGAAPLVADVWAQTPSVPPGGALTLELQIEPLHAGHFQQYGFKVIAKPLEQPELLASENGTVSIAGISTMQRLLPFVIFGGVALLAFACSTFALTNTRLFG